MLLPSDYFLTKNLKLEKTKFIMKKLFLAAALGVAGLMSASNLENVKKTNSFTNNTTIAGGYCNVDIYQQNADGSSTYIGSWGGYASSQEACDAKGRWIIFQLQNGLEPIW